MLHICTTSAYPSTFLESCQNTVENVCFSLTFRIVIVGFLLKKMLFWLNMLKIQTFFHSVSALLFAARDHHNISTEWKRGQTHTQKKKNDWFQTALKWFVSDGSFVASWSFSEVFKGLRHSSCVMCPIFGGWGLLSALLRCLFWVVISSAFESCSDILIFDSFVFWTLFCIYFIVWKRQFISNSCY